MLRRTWMIFFMCLGLAMLGCPGDDDDDTGDDDDATGDDDTTDDDTGDDDATADDDDVTGDDDDVTGDDDDVTGDDDATGDDDVTGDDDTTGDDDDTTAEAGVELLQVHYDVLNMGAVGYRQMALIGAPIALADAAAVVSGAFSGTYIDGCTPTATYVDLHWCYASPGDFGGQAIVDARTGTPVFAGEIIWDGTGQMLFPLPLGPAADMGVHVNPPLPMPQNFEWEMNGYEPQSVALAALNEARETGLVHSFVGGNSYDAFVLLQPYMVGGYNAGLADVIVFVIRY